MKQEIFVVACFSLLFIHIRFFIEFRGTNRNRLQIDKVVHFNRITFVTHWEENKFE